MYWLSCHRDRLKINFSFVHFWNETKYDQGQSLEVSQIIPFMDENFVYLLQNGMDVH